MEKIHKLETMQPCKIYSLSLTTLLWLINGKLRPSTYVLLENLHRDMEDKDGANADLEN